MNSSHAAEQLLCLLVHVIILYGFFFPPVLIVLVLRDMEKVDHVRPD